MRVLHVLDHSLPLHSGYTFRTQRILENQQKLGYETYHLTSPKQGPTAEKIEEFEGLRFYRSPSVGLSRYFPVFRQLGSIKATRIALQAYVKEIRPDIIHAHSPSLNGIAALKVAKEFGIPVVYEVRALWEDAGVDHGTHQPNSLRYRASMWLESKVLQQANQVTTICEGLKANLVARGLESDKVTIVPNAVDTQMTRQSVDHEFIQTFKKTHGIKHETCIGFLGSFYDYEGLDLLVEAMSHPDMAQYPVKCLLIGDGPARSTILDQIHKAGLEDKFVVPGKVDHAYIPSLYHMMDMCVYPRKLNRLTQMVTPLKPLEAMAFGVVVLASNVGGHLELIEANETGFLFEADNVESLRAALVQQLTHTKPMDVLFKAKNYIQEHRQWHVCAKKYQDVYQKAVA